MAALSPLFSRAASASAGLPTALAPPSAYARLRGEGDRGACGAGPAPPVTRVLAAAALEGKKWDSRYSHTIG